jgi:hypothetical protein
MMGDILQPEKGTGIMAVATVEETMAMGMVAEAMVMITERTMMMVTVRGMATGMTGTVKTITMIVSFFFKGVYNLKIMFNCTSNY